MTSASYSLEKLGRTHERGMFRCGEDALDRYLREQASQDMKRNYSTVVVATGLDSRVVLGYYTISSSLVWLDDLPDAVRKRLPRYDKIPAVLLGRLAVTETEKGRGLGPLLLADATARAHSSDIAWAVMIVNAKHEHAASFYRHFGFVSFSHDPLTLWQSRKAIEEQLVP